MVIEKVSCHDSMYLLYEKKCLINWPYFLNKYNYKNFALINFLYKNNSLSLFVSKLSLINNKRTKFPVSLTWLPDKFGSGEESKIDFQDRGQGGHLGFLIGTILAFFHQQVILMLPTKFGVNWPLGSGEEAKNEFQDSSHGGSLGFPIRMILAVLIY